MKGSHETKKEEREERMSYEQELLILSIIGEHIYIDRKRLFQEVDREYFIRHGRHIQQSNFSHALKSLAQLGLIMPEIDVERDARVRAYHTTPLYYLVYGGERIYSKGLETSHYLALTSSCDLSRKIYLMMDEGMGEGFLSTPNTSFLYFKKIEDVPRNVRYLLENWERRKKGDRSKLEAYKAEYNDFLSLHILSHLKNERVKTPEKESPKKGSIEILRDLMEGKTNLATNVPLSTILNEDVSDVAGKIIPISLCNYLLLDRKAINERRDVDVYYSGKGQARIYLANILREFGYKCHERNEDDMIKQFIANVGDGVGLITESPCLSSLIIAKLQGYVSDELPKAKQIREIHKRRESREREVKVFFYMEPLFMLTKNSDVARLERRIRNFVPNMIDIHKCLMGNESLKALISIVNKYKRVINDLMYGD